MTGQSIRTFIAACTAFFVVLSVAPASAAPLTNVKQLALGSEHSCALLNNGSVKCWGNNGFGQLGDGTKTQRLNPVTVKAVNGSGALLNVAEIATENHHTCARLKNGQVRCWGKNTGGQLGNNTDTDSNRPVVVLDTDGAGAFTGAVQLAVGSGQSCVRLQNGQARCWGWNEQGEQGNNTTTNRPLPGPVLNEAGTGPLTAVTNIVAAGGGRTCASFTNGMARCWGWGGISGQLGNGDADSRDLPAKVTKLENSMPLTQVAEIAPGGVLHACARLTTGQARCWGHNQDGQVGDGTSSQRFRAVVVETASGPLENIAQMAAGGTHSCALLTDKTARCWGLNDSGQIGDGSLTTRLHPVGVKAVSGAGALTGIAQIAAGGRFPIDCCQLTGGVHHTCALMDTSQVRCWGNNMFGQLGDGTKVKRRRPVIVEN